MFVFGGLRIANLRTKAFYDSACPMSAMLCAVVGGWCRKWVGCFHLLTSSSLHTMHVKTRVLRDIKRRNAVQATEVVRRAYLYVARNQTLPPQVRHQAQLQLNTFPKDTRPSTVKNRCTESGRGRGIMSEFGLCRFQFRLKAMNEELPGVRKASW